MEENTNERKIAKVALGALTRLRQGCNPSDGEKTRQLLEDEKTLHKCFELLSIPEGYDSWMLNFLQKLSRGPKEQVYGGH